MSEKIYTLLLGLYPRFFRETYGPDALQLLRDRLRGEPGFLPRLRLWADILIDLAASLPREHRAGRPAPTLLLSPVFERSRTRAIAVGALLSLAVPVAMAVSTNLAAASAPKHRLVARARWSPYRGTDGRPVYILSASAANAPGPGAITVADMSPEEMQRVREAAAANLREHYVDRELGARMANFLLSWKQPPLDPAVFASQATRQLREMSHDRTLSVDYFPDGLRDRSAAPPPAPGARRETTAPENCAIEKVQVLPHNIGYLKLNSFPNLSVCREKAVSALAALNGSSAIVFDLRDNRGGYPETVSFLASYLFDHPEYLYNPRENTTVRSWTHSPVAGNNLADKPAYILTSSRTYSAAEHFTFDMKALKRAVVVGETTGGGQHSGVFYRLSDHFGIGVTEVRPINPFASDGWEGTGIEPDVKVSAASALDEAVKLARRKVAGRGK